MLITKHTIAEKIAAYIRALQLSQNADLRTREHLTPDEVERLMAVAKKNRHGHRDDSVRRRELRQGDVRRAPATALRRRRLKQLSTRRAGRGSA